jgi:transcriptional regulator with XRE-family HTH domain
VSDAYLDVEALRGALDEKRRSRQLSWRQVAKQSGVSPSTLTRLAQGKRPDVDGFAALVSWLGVSADFFLRTDGKADDQPEPMVVISAHLRAQKDLSPESTEALEDIIRAAYEGLREARGQRVSKRIQGTG